MVKAIEALLAAGKAGFGAPPAWCEETDSAGAIAANGEPRGSRYLINGEPTRTASPWAPRAPSI